MTTQPTSPASPATPRGSNKSRLRLLLVIGAVIIIGLVTWLVTKGGDDNDKGSKSAESAVPVGAPTVLSESQLRAYGAAQPTPVYWAGPLPNRRYEVTRTSNGRYFVRYLTPRASVGDPAARFLTVGTYPGTNAYGALRTIAKRPGQEAVRTKSGALVVYDKKKPTSVYFSFPKQNFQVEVFDPRASRAQRFVFSGKVERLR